jgi:streptogrisin C
MKFLAHRAKSMKCTPARAMTMAGSLTTTPVAARHRAVLAATVSVLAMAGTVIMGGHAGAALAQPGTAGPGLASERRVDTTLSALFEAMQRDLGLTREQAVQRFHDEQVARDLAAQLEPQLGEQFGGAWFDEATGRLAVAATSVAAAEHARAAGADATVVRYSLRELRAAQAELDDIQRADPSRMTDAISWGVDQQSNTLVVTVLTGRTVTPVVELANRRGDQVRVEESDVVPQPADYLDGGDPLGTSPYFDKCSVGFNVYKGTTSYLLTAGHCGVAGNYAYSKGWPIGPFVESWFPGDDDALVRNDRLDLWAVGGWVAIHDPADLGYLVSGTIINIVNGSNCKSGITTKITCGTLKGFWQTVQYAGGAVVHGMTRHTACTKPGDSGGPNFTAPTSNGKVAAQGISSGSLLYSGNKCGQEVGKTNAAWFQPIIESLNWYGVKLYTA